MHKYYITALLLSLSSGAFAQEQQTYLQIADKHYHSYNYSGAIPVYEKLAAKKKVSADVLYKLAYSYDQMQNYQKALEKYQAYYYKDIEKNSDVLLRIGDLQKTFGDYSAAKQSYGQYCAKHNDANNTVANRIAGCDSSIKWLKEKPQHTISNLPLNSNVSDWGPSLFGDRLVFTSEDQKEILMAKNSKKVYGWTGNSYLRLYTVDTPNASSIADFDAFANDYRSHVGPAAFTPDMQTVYFTVTSTSRKDAEEFTISKKMNVGQRNLELYYSSKDANGQWMEPAQFSYNDLDQYSVGHAAVSKDGQVLYFVSDKPGGYGKTDIWYCMKKEDGKWGIPVNCGPNINTVEDEAFPTLGVENELYFASTGHPGMGGYDIFRSKGAMHYWDVVVNMRSPLNSSYDDFYLTASTDKKGYFSSDRPGGKGSDDIYSYLYEKPRNFVLKAIVMNKQTNKPIPGATISLDVADGVRKANAGGYTFYPLMPDRDYSLAAMYSDLTPDNTTFNTNAAGMSDTLEKILYLTPKAEPELQVGDVFVLEDLYYDLDKYNIRPDAAEVLDRLITTLNKYPTMVIELSSHTDSRATDSYNMKLSANRAKSAVAYLVGKGLAKSRLVAKGYGETKLKNGCANGVECSEADHQLNRRTEVKVLSK